MPVWSTEIIMQLCHFLSLFFFSNTLTENWDVFQLHTESTDSCSFLPSSSCWSTLIETSGKLITHCQLPLRVPLASESPKEKTRGRKHHPIPTLKLFNKSLEYLGLINKVSLQVTGDTFPCQKAGPWKSQVILLNSSLTVAQSHGNVECCDSHQENAGWSSKDFGLNLWSTSHWNRFYLSLACWSQHSLALRFPLSPFQEIPPHFFFSLGIQSQSIPQVLLIPPVLLILLLLMFLLFRRTPVLSL